MKYFPSWIFFLFHKDNLPLFWEKKSHLNKRIYVFPMNRYNEVLFNFLLYRGLWQYWIPMNGAVCIIFKSSCYISRPYSPRMSIKQLCFAGRWPWCKQDDPLGLILWISFYNSKSHRGLSLLYVYVWSECLYWNNKRNHFYLLISNLFDEWWFVKVISMKKPGLQWL